MNNGKCPYCGGNLYRDAVIIDGVHEPYGPWQCEDCAWYDGQEGEIDHRDLNDPVIQDGPCQ